jgi:amphi-Trp domain-containing protein
MAVKQALEFTGGLTVDAAAGYLEALANGLRQGHLSIESENEAVDLAIPQELTLGLEAKSAADKGKSAIEISLTWRVSRKTLSASANLIISSGTVAAAANSDNGSSAGSNE